jgi:CheY-like chemotaxis protein
MKLLIVDDDKLCLKLLSYLLKDSSFDITYVNTGGEAVRTCHKNPDIDIILLDIMIPEMNGFEVATKIREFNPNVVIIAQTALTLDGDREKSIEAGCDDYISKPYSKRDLLNIIQNNLTALIA